MPSAPVFVVLCGLPAAGKSILAQEIRARLEIEAHSVVFLISFDALIPCIHPERWKQQRSDLLRAVAEVAAGVTKRSHRDIGCSSGELVREIFSPNNLNWDDVWKCEKIYFIFDDNFYYASMRWEIFQQAVAVRAAFCEVAVQVNLDAALLRDAVRAQPVSESVIRKMHSLIQYPNASKRGFEWHSLMIPSPWSVENLDRVLDLIATASASPCVSPSIEEIREIDKLRIASREATRTSILHQADCILRKKVRDCCIALEAANSGHVALASSRCNSIRKAILAQLRYLDLTGFELRDDELAKKLDEEYASMLGAAQLLLLGSGP